MGRFFLPPEHEARPWFPGAFCRAAGPLFWRLSRNVEDASQHISAGHGLLETDPTALQCWGKLGLMIFNVGERGSWVRLVRMHNIE
jgi:hypothetical protein